MKKLLVLLSLLFVSPVYASNFSYNFTPPSGVSFNHNGPVQVPPITNNSITATFNCAWAYYRDRDNESNPPSCDTADWYSSGYVPWMGTFQNSNDGWVGGVGLAASGDTCDSHYDGGLRIDFSTNINYFSMRYATVAESRVYTCGGQGDPPAHPSGAWTWSGGYWYSHGPAYSYPGYVTMSNTGYGYADLASGGDAWWDRSESGGTQNTVLYWHTIEVIPETPCKRVEIYPGGGSMGEDGVPLQFYIDEISASNTYCPSPPCEFESAHKTREENGSGSTEAKKTTWGQLKVRYR